MKYSNPCKVVAFGFKVTPWEVEGVVDYKKLLEEFGASEITDDLLNLMKNITGELHILLSRKVFYAHRDLDLILNDYLKGKGFFLYTGIAPSKSTMHLGHVIPFILTKWLQEKFKVNAYIMIPDEEKYLAKKAESLRKVDELVDRTILDIIALGYDPDKTFIFRDREYIKNLYTAAVMVARRINYSMAKAVFGFTGETSIGLIFYPALQIVPTFFEKRRCLIPYGIDQDPYFRIQRDIAPKLGYYKTAGIMSIFIPGLEGIKSKMSASKPETAIFLSDDPNIAAKKVMNAFTGGQPTVKEQREKGGIPEICCVYQWFKILFEPNEKGLIERYRKCKRGELLCGECKIELAKRIKKFLENHQINVKKAEKIKDKFLYDGKLAREMWNWKIEYQ